MAVHANFISLPRPPPLGEVAPKVTERASQLMILRLLAAVQLPANTTPLTAAACGGAAVLLVLLLVLRKKRKKKKTKKTAEKAE